MYALICSVNTDEVMVWLDFEDCQAAPRTLWIEGPLSLQDIFERLELPYPLIGLLCLAERSSLGWGAQTIVPWRCHTGQKTYRLSGLLPVRSPSPPEAAGSNRNRTPLVVWHSFRRRVSRDKHMPVHPLLLQNRQFVTEGLNIVEE